MGITFSLFYPPAPTFTEQNLPSQKGKVFLVTGGYSGVGYQLTSILYGAGAKVYLAGRSKEKAIAAIEEIKSSHQESSNVGDIVFLPLDLADLSTVKSSVEEFQQKESHLDVLWNNAAVSYYPKDTKTAQGYELMLGTNCLGPYLFTDLLLPSLKAAASKSSPGQVRVVWTSSIVVDMSAPKNGIVLSELTSPPSDQSRNYTNSKTGNWFLASELGERVKADGILSITQNPGNLKTNLLRNAGNLLNLLVSPLLYDAKFGAYTELYAGLSPDLTMDDNGSYILPWGRKHSKPRQDLLDALKSENDGGSGIAAKLWEWCEKETEQFK